MNKNLHINIERMQEAIKGANQALEKMQEHIIQIRQSSEDDISWIKDSIIEYFLQLCRCIEGLTANICRYNDAEISHHEPIELLIDYTKDILDIDENMYQEVIKLRIKDDLYDSILNKQHYEDEVITLIINNKTCYKEYVNIIENYYITNKII